MTLTSVITEMVATTTYDDLSPESIETTKRCILDTLGVMLPPTTLGDSQLLIRDMVLSLGGTPESTLLGFGGKTSAPLAAFVNGSLAHALDFDDTTDRPPHHPTASTLPTALALAERRGGVSGRDLLTAVALGNDLSVRLACGPDGSVNMDYPFLTITTFGLWGSTIAASKVLGLTLDQIQNAFGVALHQAGGVTAGVFSTESDLRSYRDGFTNEAGVRSALMAECGITAIRSGSLEAFYDAFYRGQYSESRVLQNLGTFDRAATVSLKPWACDREIHGYVEGALNLINSGKFTADEIETVVLTVGPFGRGHLCEPLDEKRSPKLPIGAKLSLPFAVALALSRGHVLISDFLAPSLVDPAVLAMASRVSYVYDPLVGDPPGTGTPAKVAVRTTDGREFEFVVDVLLGHPSRPMDRNLVEEKFRDCAQYSATTFSSDRIDELVDSIWNLESLESASTICDLLS